MKRSHHLKLTRRAFLKSAALTSTTVACYNGIAHSAPAGRRKPNILYLMTDQHPGDCLR